MIGREPATLMHEQQTGAVLHLTCRSRTVPDAVSAHVLASGRYAGKLRCRRCGEHAASEFVWADTEQPIA